VSILDVSGPTADGEARLRPEQRGRVERLNGLTSNLRVPTRTISQPPANPSLSALPLAPVPCSGSTSEQGCAVGSRNPGPQPQQGASCLGPLDRIHKVGHILATDNTTNSRSSNPP
jgi:hypothetical protein